MQKSLKLLVSSLEPSANLHLEPILKKLEKYELFGIFDEKFGKPYLPSSAFS
ncbi:MAG: lipid-A-disaccharide synthase, partial [Epsilonproteobacteria bacterium]|nr:lipid-A-disaccharide synthase [Campylobacterota bacterium]